MTRTRVLWALALFQLVGCVTAEPVADMGPVIVPPDLGPLADLGPPLGELGGSCEATSCRTGDCVTSMAGRVCARACERDSDCGTGSFVCAHVTEGDYCVVGDDYVELPYGVANIGGEVLNIVLGPTSRDVTLSGTTRLGGTQPLPPFRYEVLPQGGAPPADRATVDVYFVRSLTINESATLTLYGDRPVIFVVEEDVVINGLVSAGPLHELAGGYPRPTAKGNGNGPGGGLLVPRNFDSDTGGGGSHCTTGGAGAGGFTRAPVYGDGTGRPLVGGSSGARGDSPGTGGGAGVGGAALQISAGGNISIGRSGAITARGRNGATGSIGGISGQGGGAGGVILLQAGGTIDIAGSLVADGGNGSYSNGGTGATGTAAATSGSGSGGGGGGFGYIRLESPTAPTVAFDAVVTPATSHACYSLAALPPAVAAAPIPQCATGPGAGAAPHCEVCSARFCCSEVTACAGDTLCAGCAATNNPGPACDGEPLQASVDACLATFCPQACSGL